MTDKTEAQPEALRLELHQECADFATSLRSAANAVQLQGQKAPPSFLKAADLFEQAASEIQQLKAQLNDRGDYFYGWGSSLQVFGSHQSIKALKAQLSVRQASPDGWRLVPESPTEEMQKACKSVVDLEQGDPEDHRYDDGLTTVNAIYAAMLSAAPPPPEREPLTDEQIEKLRINTFSTDNPFCPCDRKTMQKAVWAAERAHGIGATNDNP